jgi:hypothetical protein
MKDWKKIFERKLRNWKTQSEAAPTYALKSLNKRMPIKII